MCAIVIVGEDPNLAVNEDTDSDEIVFFFVEFADQEVWWLRH